jgi:hypothetical protein
VNMGFCTCGSYALCSDAGASGECTVSHNDGGTWTSVPCLCDPADVCGQPAYFCHTACDQCTDDSDCSSGSCLFDRRKGAWECLAPLCT